MVVVLLDVLSRIPGVKAICGDQGELKLGCGCAEVLDPIKESMMDRSDGNNDRGNASALSQMLGGSPSRAVTAHY